VPNASRKTSRRRVTVATRIWIGGLPTRGTIPNRGRRSRSSRHACRTMTGHISSTVTAALCKARARSPGFACAGKTGPPSCLIVSQTSAGNFTLAAGNPPFRSQAVAYSGASPTRIFLNPGRAQPGESVSVNQILQGQQFICRQHVAAAGLLGRQETAADRCNDFGLATNDPALRTGMREICYRQGATIRPFDGPRWAIVSGHVSRAL
jgi:hypothetical protein